MKWSGKVLHDLRTDSDMSQCTLAEKVHLSSSMISAYERNHKTPSLETVIKFAEIFQVSTDFLLGLTDIKTMPALLKKEFASGRSYNDVLVMMASFTKDQRETLFEIADYIKIVNDMRNLRNR